MVGFAKVVEHGEFDPIEIEGIAGCPNQRLDGGSAKIELRDRFGEASRLGLFRPRRWITWQVKSVCVDMPINSIKKFCVSGISVRQIGAQVGGNFKLAVLCGQHASQQGDALFREVTEIDSVTAICSRDQRQRFVGTPLLCGRSIETNSLSHQIRSRPQYLRGRRRCRPTDRYTRRPASWSSSAICAPEAPEPTISTAPGGNWSGDL